MPRHHLVFDVNETLLDLSSLDAVFADLFGDSRARSAWFASLLHWSTVTTLSGAYRDFSALAGDCLDTLATSYERPLAYSDRERVFAAIGSLAPHPEVPDALTRLKTAGFTLVALTNSAQASVDRQFEQAGLTPLFAHVLSVDRARVFKPHPQAYAVAAHALDCPLGAIRLIAAHDWDVTGALRAGCAAAYVARGNTPFNPAGDKPDIIGADLTAVADQLIARAC